MPQPPKTITRRTILANTAVVSTAMAALAPVGSARGLAHIKPVDIADPVYAAIDLHRMAFARLTAVLKESSRLEEELPAERRQSGYDHEEGGLVFVDSDDPRWIASEQAVEDFSNAERRAAAAFLQTEPSTLAGILAALAYVAGYETERHYGFGSYFDGAEGGEAEWHILLHRSLARAIARIAS